MQQRDAACTISFSGAGDASQKATPAAKSIAKPAAPQTAAQKALKEEQLRQAAAAVKANKAKGENSSMLHASTP